MQPRREKPLTDKQEKFCRAIAEGRNQADAYREAFEPAPTVKPDSIYQAASRLVSKAKVQSRIEELRAITVKRWAWTREDSINTLKQVIAEGKGSERVAAVKELNAMHGFQEAKKLDISGSGLNFNFNLGDKDP